MRGTLNETLDSPLKKRKKKALDLSTGPNMEITKFPFTALLPLTYIDLQLISILKFQFHDVKHSQDTIPPCCGVVREVTKLYDQGTTKVHEFEFYRPFFKTSIYWETVIFPTIN